MIQLKDQYARTDTLLLDMDGTLLDLHFDHYFWTEHLPNRFAEIHNQDLETCKSKLAGELKAHEGTLNWYDTKFWAEQFDVDIIGLKQEVSSKITYRPGTETFLQTLKNQDLRVILVTNADLSVLELKHEATGILDHLDTVISSHHYGHAKESQAFWHALHDQFSIDKSTTMLIDDSHPVLVAAQKYGIAHTVRVTSPDSQRTDSATTEFHGIHNLNELFTESLGNT